MRYASRVDATHEEIRTTLRSMGFRVLDTSKYPGFVDFVVRRRHAVWLVDAKTPQNKAGRFEKTKAQERIEQHGFEIVYLTSADQALAWGQEQR